MFEQLMIIFEQNKITKILISKSKFTLEKDNNQIDRSIPKCLLNYQGNKAVSRRYNIVLK
ncbi:unnamed protein product (macronuclear) [Paramecium tetraurelia]|uniref:Uncharacterized protein n=1 Tax=Paramecium tetraurelia TaxID=5888 RepID=A0BPC8_PARTE|nr:uncharacterized protein GSPATT00005144001 [Paramecium tetraurelia]CAK60395.1 unnamed protein product [Paramecium tetraurelia]|eukprot:XP_001427793.1 hypothetical protein (macronuclear) [Paramecium tetraurelia strain d4-2]